MSDFSDVAIGIKLNKLPVLANFLYIVVQVNVKKYTDCISSLTKMTDMVIQVDLCKKLCAFYSIFKLYIVGHLCRVIGIPKNDALLVE